MRSYSSFVVVLCLGSSLFILSCKSTKESTQPNTPIQEETSVIEQGPTSKIARFTTSDAVADLKAGMTYDEVVSKLGVKPYNVYSIQAGGFHVVQYKYKLLEMEVPTSGINEYGIEKKNNKLSYKPDVMDLYISFGPNGKLESLLTTEGRSNTEGLIKASNILNIQARDKMKFGKDSLSGYRALSTEYLPLQVCPDCPTVDQKTETQTKPVTKEEIAQEPVLLLKDPIPSAPPVVQPVSAPLPVAIESIRKKIRRKR